ncbi:MAG: site-2 protease family protein, partial [Holosporales bacterium]|nr:site-2 protease family protein [Holosporales bacterium]
MSFLDGYFLNLFVYAMLSGQGSASLIGFFSRMGFIGSAIALIIVIFVLVVVHEFGHLIAARKNGVFVEAFSVG